jgi:hypothetical protein
VSAALQLSKLWGGTGPEHAQSIPATDAHPVSENRKEADSRAARPVISMGFYRKHTESLLQRYLYASMQVGRTPSILGEPVARGWASCRRVRTFEDAVIFVLDVERCLDRLGALERQILQRVVLQAYTQSEAAMLLGMSMRAMAYKFPQALDCLTEKLLDAELLSFQQ